MIALLIAAGTGAPVRAQSVLPTSTQPARSLPAKVTSSSPVAIEPQIVLRNVTILRGKTSIEIHMDASGPVMPVARVFSNPERIVIDLPDVGYTDSRRLPVNAGDVQAVRVALFHAVPPVTRVVVDLAHPREYRLVSVGGRVTVVVETGDEPASVTTPAAEKGVSAPVPGATALPPPTPLADTPKVSASATQETPQPPPILPVEVPAQPPAKAAPVPTAQPPEPAVSTELPQVASVAVSPAHLSQTAAEDETTPHQAAKGNKPGVVSNVTVLRGKDTVEVHIDGTKPLRASASTLNNPERIIIDLADTRLPRPRHIPVNVAGVQAVDCSLYLVNPLVTRVVVNLAHAHPYHVLTYGSSLIVKIETEEVKAAGSPPVR